MAFSFNGYTPGVIKFNWNQVNTLVYNGVTVWAYNVTVSYTGACGNQITSDDPTFTLATSNASPVYSAGTYKYKLVIPYKKTMSDTLGIACYIIPKLRDVNGNDVATFGQVKLDGSKGTDVRYITLEWTSDAWLGNASTYKLYIDVTGGNKDYYRYPRDYNITLTATNA